MATKTRKEYFVYCCDNERTICVKEETPEAAIQFLIAENKYSYDFEEFSTYEFQVWEWDKGERFSAEQPRAWEVKRG